MSSHARPCCSNNKHDFSLTTPEPAPGVVYKRKRDGGSSEPQSSWIKAHPRSRTLTYLSVLVCLALLPGLIAAQSLNDEFMFPGDESWQDPQYDILRRPEYGLSGLLGTLMADGHSYTQLRLKPEFAIWKLGLGLDFDLLVDGEGKLRSDDWDSWRDLLGKLLYLRFADRSDSLYFKIGSIPDYTLGHGLIFDDFSNTLRYPSTKPVGGYLGTNTTSYGFGFEVYTHDISRNEIIAARASLIPLQASALPLIRNIRLGINLGLDRNPYGKYPDTDNDGYPDIYDKFPQNAGFHLDSDDDGVADDIDLDLNGNSVLDHPDHNPYVAAVFPGIDEIYPSYPFDTAVYPDSAAALPGKRPLTVYSLEYDLPLVHEGRFRLSHYAEYAIMKGHGSGMIWPGFVAKLGFLEAKLELRNFGARFLPSYFNNLYDEQRSQMLVTPGEDGQSRIYGLTTKDRLLAEIKPSFGWFGYLRGNLGKLGHLKVAYQDMYGDSLATGKSLWAKFTVIPQNLPQLKEASLYYAQTDINRVSFRQARNPNARISGRLVYAFSKDYAVVLRYSEYYRDLDGNGIIKGRNEVIEALNLGVEFQF